MTHESGQISLSLKLSARRRCPARRVSEGVSIAITDHISLHPVNPIRNGSSRPAQFTLKVAMRACRAWFDWHPILGGFTLLACAALAVPALLALFAALLPTVEGSTVVTPLNGMVLAALLLSRRKLWPFLLFGYILALAKGSALFPSVHRYTPVEIFGNTLEVTLSAFILPPFRNLKQWLQDRRLLLAFTGYALVLGPAIKAFAMAAAGAHSGFWDRARASAASESLGIALATPLVLVLANRQTYRLLRLQKLPATLGLFTCLVATTWFAFSGTAYPVFFLPCAVVVAIAFFLGLNGAVLATTVASGIIVHLATYSPMAAGQAGFAQSYLAATILAALPLSVALFHRSELEQRTKDYQAELDKLKSLDRLTGVANRKRFDLVLNREWQRATRDPKPIALLMIDVDFFDAYNDQYGANAGDECLRLIATKLSEQPHRQYDLVSRFEGGRFSVLLPGASGEAVKRIGEEFRAEVAALGWPNPRSQFSRVTVSVGWAAMLPETDLKPELLVSAAEAALASAKKKGRNRVEGFSSKVIEMSGSTS